jgi:hypothetical protein
MKVKIIKCDSTMSWYRNQIGSIYDVADTENRFGGYDLELDKTCFIKSKDCEIVIEKPSKKKHIKPYKIINLRRDYDID